MLTLLERYTVYPIAAPGKNDCEGESEKISIKIVVTIKAKPKFIWLLFSLILNIAIVNNEVSKAITRRRIPKKP